MKKISSLEYSTLIWFIIKACFAELTITTIIYQAKEDCWLAAIISSIIGLIPFTIYEYLKNKYPKENYITLNEKLYKSRINLPNIITLLGSLIALICTFWILVHFTNSVFLYRTNSWIISITLILPIAYAAKQGVKIISKVSLILFYISIFIILTTMIGTISEVDINNIKPIFSNEIIYPSITFTALSILKVFFLSIIPKEKIDKYSSKKNYLTYFLVCLTMIDITFITICIFGIDLALLYEYPAFQILKRVNILGVIDRVESILSIEGMFSIFIEMTIITSFAKENIKKTFNLKEKTNTYIIISICLITVIISNIMFKNQKFGEMFFSGPLLYIIYIVCLLAPLITLIKSLKNPKLVSEEN